MLQKIIFGIIIVQPILRRLLPPRQIGRPEDPVPDGEFSRIIGIKDRSVVRMVPLMHLGPIDEVLQFTTSDIDIGVNIHPPYRIYQRLDRHYRRIGAQQ